MFKRRIRKGDIMKKSKDDYVLIDFLTSSEEFKQYVGRYPNNKQEI